MYFSSPTSNITPAQVSVAMTRSDSRDSTCSSTHSQYHFTSAPMQVSYSTSPMHYHAHAMARTSSSASSTRSTSTRRESSSNWLPSPYRSCMLHSSQEEHEPSSYLSDDDLLYLECNAPTSNPLPIESIPNPEPVLRRKELTTEEQIVMLREMQEREHQQQYEQRRSQQKAVRFAPEQRKPRRSSHQQQRRSTSVRKGL